MLALLFTGCGIQKNNHINKVELKENESKVLEENQTNESKKNETEQKDENTEKIENEIDLSEIDLSGEDEVSGIMVGGHHNGTKSWGYIFKKFKGIGTIRKFKSNKDEEIEFEYSSKASEGNVNVIFLDEDNNILKKLGANEDKTFKLSIIKDEVYSIRIIGDNAEDGQVSIKIVNQNLEIQTID